MKPLAEIDARTNIELDDNLIAEAMAATGLTTKKATVEEALRALVVSYQRKQAIEALDGIGWEGNLRDMRTDKSAR